MQNLFLKKNALILLYGNTGSGKTYSIFGDSRYFSTSRMSVVKKDYFSILFVVFSILHSNEARNTTWNSPWLACMKSQVWTCLGKNRSCFVNRPTAENKGKYSPSNNPQYLEHTATSFMQARSIVSNGQSNEKDFEARERFVSADSHMIYVIRLIQCLCSMTMLCRCKWCGNTHGYYAYCRSGGMWVNKNDE